MPRTRRKRIALFLSLLMTALLLCQGMAQAMTLRTALPAAQHASTGMAMSMDMPCHASAQVAGNAQPEHTGDCQHLDNVSDSPSHLLTPLDHFVPMLAFLLPATSEDVGAIALMALSSAPPDPNPPATLRFHRFRE